MYRDDTGEQLRRHSFRAELTQLEQAKFAIDHPACPFGHPRNAAYPPRTPAWSWDVV
jgi:hypothetical protein